MGRGISAGTRKELIKALAHRYQNSVKNEKTRILDEFGAITGYHRKHAARLLGKNWGDIRN